MNYTNRHYQIALTQLFGFGPKRSRQLIQSVNDLESIFTLSYRKLSDVTGISPELLRKMERKRALDWSVDVVKDLDRFGIRSLFFSDTDYPRRLRHCEDAPLVIYTKGEMNLNASRFVSVVGTRAMSEYGKKICEELVESLRGTTVQVVSGLAYGVDIAIHRACLKQGLPTIAVLAHGLEMVYPRIHASVARKMCATGGLISEFPPFTNPDKENFPMRNRIVAGISDATIVVESKARGGSLITADLANDYNRDVFAFPGGVYDINSEGCNNLIASHKAHLIRSGEDFLRKMSWDTQSKHVQQQCAFQELSEDEQAVISLLGASGDQHVDVLATRTFWPVSRLSVVLFQLEMNGLICSLPGNKYRLV